MSKAKQTDRLKELLKHAIVIDLDKRGTNPFDIFQLQVQLNQISELSPMGTISHRFDSARAGTSSRPVVNSEQFTRNRARCCQALYSNPTQHCNSW